MFCCCQGQCFISKVENDLMRYYFVLNELQSSLIFLLYPALLLRDRAFSIRTTETFRSLTIINISLQGIRGLSDVTPEILLENLHKFAKKLPLCAFSINRLQLALSCAWKIQLRFTWAEQSRARFEHPQHKVVTTQSVAGSQDLPCIYP